MKRYVLVVVAVFALAAIACCGSGRTSGVRATNTPRATNTAGPSPTPTPRLLSPTCKEILDARAAMTDAQWDNYKEEVAGTWIDKWEGHIREVRDRGLLIGGYPIYIEISQRCDLYYVVQTEEEALSFSKGQPVIVTGQVDLISLFFGDVTLHLEDYTVEIE